MVETLQFKSYSPDETAAFAHKIAPELIAGDVILLEGQIGGGKTHFARSLIQHLLASGEDVPSPTFTLVQTYETGDSEIWHSDLYRLSHPDEVFELGLVDAFSDAISLIEWPDRLGDLAPKSSLTLGFLASDVPEERQITAKWTDDRWNFLMGLSDV